MGDAVDLRIEAGVVLHVVRDHALAAAGDPAGEAGRWGQADADQGILAQRLGRGEDQLLPVRVVQHERERLGLGETLQAIQHDAQDLGELEGRRERPDELVDGAKLAELLLDQALPRGTALLGQCHGSRE